MAVTEERSLGPLYLAWIHIDPGTTRDNAKVGIVQMKAPWRAGTAWAFPFVTHALVLGWWRKRCRTDYADDVQDDLWLDPHWMGSVPASDISTWDRGDEEPVEEGEPQEVRPS